MNTPLEELQAEIDANTELSVSVSEIESMLLDDSEPGQRDDPAHESSPEHYTDQQYRDQQYRDHQYTDATLGDDAVLGLDGWLDEEYLHNSSDEIVVAQLDEILLALIAIRAGGCGKELLQDVRRLFGTDLSPGTVYPHLNDLAEEGVLEVSELSKRKVYRLSDREAALDTVESTVNQLVAISLVLKTLTTNCNTCHPQSTDGETDER